MEELQSAIELNDRKRLREILGADLDFKAKNVIPASHNFHAFPAKFPPQLPRYFIEKLTDAGDVLLDPMMGSGTSIVEGMLSERKAIGFDIDPLAVLIATIKTTNFEKFDIQNAFSELLGSARNLYYDSPIANIALAERYDEDTKKFINYWFYPQTQKEIISLVLAIENIQDSKLRDFFKVALSSIIITKSGGVSRARDLAHSRPHLDKNKIVKNAFESYTARVVKLINALTNYGYDSIQPIIKQADAKQLPLADSSIDLIITSPPYANAIDYMRAHKFTLVWFGESVKVLSEIRATYIGSERAHKPIKDGLPERCVRTAEKVYALDHSKSAILLKYFNEMKRAFEEMIRVLKTGKSAVVVVGSSTMRGIDVETHLNLAEIAESVGFEIINIAKRSIDRDKRMLPTRFGGNKTSGIEDRMHEEFVLGLLKP